jgi:predicted enzyme related to lactoylglutathione lyase
VVQSVTTVICQTSDMDRSVAFYRDVLGLTPGHVSPHWSDFVVGSVRIGIHPPFESASPPYSVPKKGWVLGLKVSDVAAVRERAIAAGLKVADDYHEIPGGVLIDLEDPDGHPIQAIQTGIKIKELAAAV